ncbi:hypothetical protein D0T08_05880 [Emticicia sp. C21]|nr:hypothetical protein D0T08_05880 [Emticicia sp. C21]
MIFDTFIHQLIVGSLTPKRPEYCLISGNIPAKDSSKFFKLFGNNKITTFDLGNMFYVLKQSTYFRGYSQAEAYERKMYHIKV